MDKEFGKKFCEARLKVNFLSVEDDYNADPHRLLNILISLDEGYTPEELGISIYEGSYISRKLQIDFDSFMDGKIIPLRKKFKVGVLLDVEFDMPPPEDVYTPNDETIVDIKKAVKSEVRRFLEEALDNRDFIEIESEDYQDFYATIKNIRIKVK